MVLESELITFILGVALLVFLVAGRLRFREFPAWKTMAAAICVNAGAWTLTIVEGLWGHLSAGPILEALCNMLEHICYATTSLLFALWCWQALRAKKGARE